MTGEAATEADNRTSRARYKIPDGVTFEMLLGFDSKLTMLAVKFEAFTATLQAHAGSDRDHETRIRLLESSITALNTSSTTSRGNWKEVWYVLLAALTLFASVGNTLAFILLSRH